MKPAEAAPAPFRRLRVSGRSAPPPHPTPSLLYEQTVIHSCEVTQSRPGSQLCTTNVALRCQQLA